MFPIFGGEIPDLAEKIYDCTTVEVGSQGGSGDVENG